MQVSTIGVDLAKNVFQVHGVDSAGKVVIIRQLRRKQVIDFFSKIPPCLVGMEACGTAHHWAREVVQARSHRASDAAELREGLCQTVEKRC
jgi:transposase